MIQDPFPDPDPGPSGGEADSSPPPPADDDGEGLAQGFYVCTPPEQLTLAGFAQNGEPDTMAPGPFLATVMHAVTGEDGKGLDGCSEDQLLGIISAARRQQSRDEWTLLAATAAYAARHAGSRAADNFAPRRARLRTAPDPAVRRRGDGLRDCGHHPAAGPGWCQA